MCYKMVNKLTLLKIKQGEKGKGGSLRLKVSVIVNNVLALYANIELIWHASIGA